MKLFTSPKQQAVLNKLFSLSQDVCYQSASSMRFLGVKKKKRSANVFLWHQIKNMFAGKFSCVARAYYVQCQVSWGLWTEWDFFSKNCIIKWVIFFAGFFWLPDFLVGDLKLKRTPIMSTGTCGRISKCCKPKVTFSKK